VNTPTILVQMNGDGEDQPIEQSQAASASVAKPAPKPKKRSPQKSVDRFWDKFNTKFPGIVRNILPANAYAKTLALHSPKGVVRGEGEIV